MGIEAEGYVIDLKCDCVDCEQLHAKRENGIYGTNKKNARIRAESLGWVRKGKKWFAPHHFIG